MAYPTSAASLSRQPSESDSQAAPSSGARFAPLELKVIALAEADPVASIGPPTRFTRFFERWFGFKRPAPLADVRLEALRRFAVLARVAGGRLPGEEVDRFVAAGFTLLHARTLQRRAASAAS